MYPILLNFGFITIYSYGLFVAVALIAATYYSSYSIKTSKKKLISQDELHFLIIYVFILALAGGRLFYVFTDMGEFVLEPLNIFKLWHGGFVYYGGFISALIFLFVHTRKKKMLFLKLCDFFAPVLALAHAIGRIGCFFAGCCYGKHSSLPWSVVFMDKNSLAIRGEHLHPTQLYEALANFLLFIFLHFYSKKENRAGMIFGSYLMIYTVLRFIIEFFRNDYRGGIFFYFSISQVISIFLFITGVYVVCKKK
ncbi:MAG: prolipoprotein diacylglyceryl transferase [Endomicrobium sp.]|jgi:phosphatidylglycerol:prolipoprotein diacylglycerol transferase|nr:prolipoprotein diacylglyceryl transferase [Endomicrobium sp.]